MKTHQYRNSASGTGEVTLASTESAIRGVNVHDIVIFKYGGCEASQQVCHTCLGDTRDRKVSRYSFRSLAATGVRLISARMNLSAT